VPYYDRLKAHITFDQMLDGLKAANAGDVFLMQGVCHNPTGADMTAEQFDTLLDLLEARGIIPWIDLAYLGFAQSWDTDCAMARKIAARFPECIICITLSKSFGIYRDRAGAAFVKTRAGDRNRIHRAVSAIVRSSASHAPDHGPSVVRTILQDESLKSLWLDDLDRMRARRGGAPTDCRDRTRTPWHKSARLHREAIRHVLTVAFDRCTRDSADARSWHPCRERRARERCSIGSG